MFFHNSVEIMIPSAPLNCNPANSRLFLNYGLADIGVDTGRWSLILN